MTVTVTASSRVLPGWSLGFRAGCLLFGYWGKPDSDVFAGGVNDLA